MSTASKLHDDNDGFGIGCLWLVIGIPLIAFAIFLITDDEHTIEPKPYDPMICYVITAEGEGVPCP